MVNFQVTPCPAPAEGIELNFRGLYLYRTIKGHNPNQVEVITREGYGSLVANKWEVYDGLSEIAKVVARAEGLHINAGHWHNSFSLVFEDQRFKGSTLQVMGTDVLEGEWAIVGGTGQFALAKGVIHKRNVCNDIVELIVEGFCPKLKGSKYQIPQIIPTKIGTWGGDKGAVNDIPEPPKRLESITIYTGFVVDSLKFSYVDQAGQKRTAGPWGGSGGGPHEIQLGPSEYVKEISGTIGEYYEPTVVTSIKLVTNVRPYGPYGLNKAVKTYPFSIPVPAGCAVTGFYGRSGVYLNGIGVYVAPISK